jgi:uncharacterized delta-60 repeat protein
VRRTSVVAFALGVALVFTAASSQAAAGQRDPTFGRDGVALTSIGTRGGGASSVALQADGKIVVGGWAWTDAGSDFALARYEPDGSLDPAFGQGGAVTTHMSEPDARASAVAIQPDGRIVAAGGEELARYNGDGSLDSTFGDGGKVSTELGGMSAVVLEPDGMIVVAGGVPDSSGNEDFALARFRHDGALDSNFGNRGVATTSIGTGSAATSLVLQADGKLVAGGFAYGSYPYVFALARYNRDGSMDASFGKAGIVVTPLTGAYWGVKLALQSDGKILAGGSAGNESEFALARYLPNGSLDPGFGAGGTVVTQPVNETSHIDAIALQPDGKIVVGGPGGNVIDLARYNPDGALDATFGAGGIVASPVWITADDPYPASLAGFALQPDGGIVVAANGPQCCLGNARYSFAVTRYLGAPNCLVPNLRAKREPGAMSTLVRDGCLVGTIRHHFSRGVRKGRVMSQDPFPEVVKSPGTAVDFVVSRGPRRR